MLKQQIVVTGAGGQLGQTLRVLAVSEKEYDFVFLDRQELPIENFEAIKKYFESVRPAFCINCAAYT
ncbi:MAG TPA: sugar nucleotide-binding protein, partial [Puia sp.]|nr:sugar nucleotide-binding protein [Puia sp.]